MVKHSLLNLLEKYPYFLDKRKVSNLYKITKVNNSLFQDLYNSLFHTYESFHINKRLLVWRTQDKPYIFQNHFCCSFPNIKSVKIYKNDEVIHQDDFVEELNKTDYEWVYESEYYKSNMLPLTIFECSECGEIYYGELPVHCTDCDGNTYIPVHAYKCDKCGEIYYTNPNSDGEVEITCENECTDNTFIEVYAFKCLGNNYTLTEEEGTGNVYLTTDCGEIYLSEKPPSTCTLCGNTGYSNETKLYPSEDIILINDNSELYDEIVEPIIVTDTRTHFYFEQNGEDYYVKGENLQSDLYYFVFYYLSASSIYLESQVNSDDVFDYDVRIYSSPVDIFEEFSTGATLEEIEEAEIPVDYIGDLTIFPNEDIYIEEKQPIHLYNRLILDSRTYNTDDTDTVNSLPVISDDLFQFYVETWDEYWELKGYPENDTFQENIFDHDYSLDELGALNNIPRKEYIVITNEELYPLTEPPYNKQTTEDDYHYMKRMIEYNLRQWGNLRLLDLTDEDYSNYLEFLHSISISDADYEIYKNNTRLFRERYNPVSLELWKNYSINSRLVNREHKLLKLFDLRKHNTHYIPYKTDEDGNPLMDYNGSYIYKDKWEVVTDLSEDWTPTEWEHKDKFCDGSQLYGEYLYVTASTLRPVPFENVDVEFKLLNSLAEPVNEDYYVNLYYFTDNKSQIRRLGSRDIRNGKTTISFKIISTEIPTHIRAVAYNSNDEFIDCCDVTLNPRNCSNADLYVDAEHLGYTLLPTDYFENPNYWTVPPIKIDNDFIFTEDSELTFNLPPNSSIIFDISEEDLDRLGIRTESEEIFFEDIEASQVKIETVDGECTVYYYEDGEENIFENSMVTAILISPNNDEFTVSNLTFSDYDYLNYHGTGSKDYPFLSLQDALNRVNQNFSVIALKNNIKLIEPVFVNNTCKILGCRNDNDNVPVIINPFENKFFRIIGGKNCNLTLVDLRLKHGLTNNYVGISTWTNNNKTIDNYTSVITKGGLVIINATIDKETYYPIDTIQISGVVKDKNDNLLSNQNILISFDNQNITTVTSDSNGEFRYNLNIREEYTGIYNLGLQLVSDAYFPTTEIIRVYCTESRDSYNVLTGETVTIESTDLSDYEGQTLKVIIDGVDTEDTVTVTNGEISYEYTATWGKHDIVFATEDGVVVKVVIVETIIPLSELNNTVFIKNIDIASDSTLSYSTLTVNNNTLLGDLNGIVSNMKVSGVFLDIDTFNVDDDRSDEEYALASECEKLAECLVLLEYDSETTIISYERLGRFWEIENNGE